MILDLTFSMVSLVTGVYVHTLAIPETVTSSKEVCVPGFCCSWDLSQVLHRASRSHVAVGAVAAHRVWTQKLGNLLPFVPISPFLIAGASQDGLRDLLIS